MSDGGSPPPMTDSSSGLSSPPPSPATLAYLDAALAAANPAPPVQPTDASPDRSAVPMNTNDINALIQRASSFVEAATTPRRNGLATPDGSPHRPPTWARQSPGRHSPGRSTPSSSLPDRYLAPSVSPPRSHGSHGPGQGTPLTPAAFSLMTSYVDTNTSRVEEERENFKAQAQANLAELSRVFDPTSDSVLPAGVDASSIQLGGMHATPNNIADIRSVPEEREADTQWLRRALRQSQDAHVAAVESKAALELKLDKLVVVSQQDAEDARRELQASRDALSQVSGTHAKVVADERQRREQVEHDMLNTRRASKAFERKCQDQQGRVEMLQHELGQEQEARRELAGRLKELEQGDLQQTEAQGQLLGSERRRRQDLESEMDSLRTQAQQLAPLHQQMTDDLMKTELAVKQAGTQNVEQEQYIRLLEGKLQGLRDAQPGLDEVLAEKDLIKSQHEQLSEQLHEAERAKAKELDRMRVSVQAAADERDAAIARSRRLQADYEAEMTASQQTLTESMDETANLKAKCSNAESLCEELRHEAADMAQGYKQLEKAVIEVEQDRAALRVELIQNRDKVGHQESELLSLRSFVSEVQQHAANAESANEELQKSMQSQGKEYAQLLEDHAVVQQSVQEANIMVDDLRSRLQDAEDEADSQRAGSDRLNETLAMIQSGEAQKAARLQALQEQEAAKQIRLQTLEAQVVRLAEGIEEKERALDSKDKEAAALMELVGQFDARIQEKEDACVARVAEAAQVCTNSEQKMKHLEAQVVENCKVAATKDEEISTLTDLISEFDVRTKEKDQLCAAEVANVCLQLDAARGDVMRLRSQSETLEGQVSGLGAELVFTKKILAQTETQVKKMESMLIDGNSNIDRLESTLVEATKEVEDCRTEAQNVHLELDNARAEAESYKADAVQQLAEIVAARDDRVADLQRQLDEAIHDVDENKAAEAASAERTSRLRDECNQMRKQLHILAGDHHAEIDRLQAELVSKDSDNEALANNYEQLQIESDASAAAQLTVVKDLQETTQHSLDKFEQSIKTQQEFAQSKNAQLVVFKEQIGRAIGVLASANSEAGADVGDLNDSTELSDEDREVWTALTLPEQQMLHSLRQAAKFSKHITDQRKRETNALKGQVEELLTELTSSVEFQEQSMTSSVLHAQHVAKLESDVQRLSSALSVTNAAQREAENQVCDLKESLAVVQGNLIDANETVADWVETSAKAAALEQEVEGLRQELVEANKDAQQAKRAFATELAVAHETTLVIRKESRDLQQQQMEADARAREAAQELIESHRQQLTDLNDQSQKTQQDNSATQEDLNRKLHDQSGARRMAESRATQLQESLSMTQAELVEARDKIADWIELFANKSAVEQEVDELRHELTLEKEASRTAEDAFNTELAAVREACSIAQGRIRDLQQQQETAEADAHQTVQELLSSHQQQVGDLNARVRKTKEEGDAVQEGLDKELQSQRASRRKAESRTTQLQESLSMTQAELAEAREKIADWVELSANKSAVEHEASKQLRQELTKVAEDAQSTKTSLASELVNMQESLSKAESQVQQGRHQQQLMNIDALRKEKDLIEAHSHQISELSKKLHQAQQSREDYKDAVETMESNVAKASSELAVLQRARNELEHAHEKELATVKLTAAEATAGLQSELNLLKAERDSAEAELRATYREMKQTLTSEVQAQKSAIVTYELHISTLQNNLKSTQAELDDARLKITDRIQLSANNSVMEQEVDELRHDLENVKEIARSAKLSNDDEAVRLKGSLVAAERRVVDLERQMRDDAVEVGRKSKAQLDACRRQVSELNDALNQAQDRISACEAATKLAEAALEAKAADLAAVKKDHDKLAQSFEEKDGGLKRAIANTADLQSDLNQCKADANSAEATLRSALRQLQEKLDRELQVQFTAQRKTENRANKLQETLTLTQAELAKASDKLDHWAREPANASALGKEVGTLRNELAKVRQATKAAKHATDDELKGAKEASVAAEKGVRDLQQQQQQLVVAARRKEKTLIESHRRQMIEASAQLKKAERSKRQYEAAVKKMGSAVGKVSADISGWHKQYAGIQQVHQEQLAAVKRAADEKVARVQSGLAKKHETDILNLTSDLMMGNTQGHDELKLMGKQLEDSKNALQKLGAQLKRQQIESLEAQQDLHTSYQHQLLFFGDEVSKAANDSARQARSAAEATAEMMHLKTELSTNQVARQRAESMVTSLTETLNQTRTELDESRLKLSEVDKTNLTHFTTSRIQTLDAAGENDLSFFNGMDMPDCDEPSRGQKLGAETTRPNVSDSVDNSSTGHNSKSNTSLLDSYRRLMVQHVQLRSSSTSAEAGFKERHEQRLVEVKEHVQQLVFDLCDSKDREIFELQQRLSEHEQVVQNKDDGIKASTISPSASRDESVYVKLDRIGSGPEASADRCRTTVVPENLESATNNVTTNIDGSQAVSWKDIVGPNKDPTRIQTAFSRIFSGMGGQGSHVDDTSANVLSAPGTSNAGVDSQPIDCTLETVLTLGIELELAKENISQLQAQLTDARQSRKTSQVILDPELSSQRSKDSSLPNAQSTCYVDRHPRNSHAFNETGDAAGIPIRLDQSGDLDLLQQPFGEASFQDKKGGKFVVDKNNSIVILGSQLQHRPDGALLPVPDNIRSSGAGNDGEAVAIEKLQSVQGIRVGVGAQTDVVSLGANAGVATAGNPTPPDGIEWLSSDSESKLPTQSKAVTPAVPDDLSIFPARQVSIASTVAEASSLDGSRTVSFSQDVATSAVRPSALGVALTDDDLVLIAGMSADPNAVVGKSGTMNRASRTAARRGSVSNTQILDAENDSNSNLGPPKKRTLLSTEEKLSVAHLRDDSMTMDGEKMPRMSSTEEVTHHNRPLRFPRPDPSPNAQPMFRRSNSISLDTNDQSMPIFGRSLPHDTSGRPTDFDRTRAQTLTRANLNLAAKDTGDIRFAKKRGWWARLGSKTNVAVTPAARKSKAFVFDMSVQENSGALNVANIVNEHRSARKTHSMKQAMDRIVKDTRSQRLETTPEVGENEQTQEQDNSLSPNRKLTLADSTSPIPSPEQSARLCDRRGKNLSLTTGTTADVEVANGKSAMKSPPVQPKSIRKRLAKATPSASASIDCGNNTAQASPPRKMTSVRPDALPHAIIEDKSTLVLVVDGCKAALRTVTVMSLCLCLCLYVFFVVELV